MMHVRSTFAVACGFALALTAPASAVPVIFTANYVDAPGEGFNDPNYPLRVPIFEYALGLFSSYFESSYAGETIVVHARFESMGGSDVAAPLAAAGPAVYYGVTAPGIDAWMPSALGNHYFASDLSPGEHEIEIFFNSDVDGDVVLGDSGFYYGTDQQAGSDNDFITVAMHELLHGLGFTSSLRPGTGEYDVDFDNDADFPTIYDLFLQADGVTLFTATPEERLAALDGNPLIWTGPGGIAGNGGTPPVLFNPTPYLAGASWGHLDEAIHGIELMSPLYSGPDHELGLVELGMLADMGWTVVPEPALAGWAMAALALCVRRRAARGR